MEWQACLTIRKHIMNKTLLIAALLLTGCATTVYQPYEAKNASYEGRGGTKQIVDGMEIWDNGDPPRKFKLIGIIDDSRPGGIIPMAQLKGDMVKKAREAGGDALIVIRNDSQIVGYVSGGTATATAYGNTATAYGSGYSSPVSKHVSKYAVIKYLE